MQSGKLAIPDKLIRRRDTRKDRHETKIKKLWCALFLRRTGERAAQTFAADLNPFMYCAAKESWCSAGDKGLEITCDCILETPSMGLSMAQKFTPRKISHIESISGEWITY
jgi:hypothetical protein